MAKNLVSGLILIPSAQIWATNFLSSLLPLLGVRHCFKLSLYAISYREPKLMNQTWQNGKKPSFRLDFGPFGPNSGCQFFIFIFQNIWLRQSLDIIVSYNYVQYQKKLMIQSWENLVTDGQTDRRTDGRTEGWEWFHRTLSD